MNQALYPFEVVDFLEGFGLVGDAVDRMWRRIPRFVRTFDCSCGGADIAPLVWMTRLGQLKQPVCPPALANVSVGQCPICRNAYWHADDWEPSTPAEMEFTMRHRRRLMFGDLRDH